MREFILRTTAVVLGNGLYVKGRLDEAIACHRKAIELDPKLAIAHSNLGLVLVGKGQMDEAIACLRKALELDPKIAITHYGLGAAFYGKGQMDEAIACLRKALELDPKIANGYQILAAAFYGKSQMDEVIACLRKAIEFEPKNSPAHLNLGVALKYKGQLDEAIICFKKALELDPKYVSGHNNLGAALKDKGQLDEAIICYKKALELDPKYAFARDNLAIAERIVAFRDKLPGYLNGSYKPATSAECLGLAEWCQVKKLNHTTAVLYAAAFAADPKLANDLQSGNRYNAVCYAVIAAAGQGEDAPKLDDAHRTRLRKQALDWLRADLQLWSKKLESGLPAERTMLQKTLAHWQKDADLAGIRDAAALAKLPADEQKAFTQLWADVAALLKKASTPAMTGEKK